MESSYSNNHFVKLIKNIIEVHYMPNPSTFIPKGFHTATPFLYIKNAASAIDFYKKAFAAEEQIRLEMPNGKIAYACVKIGDSPIMLADEFLEMNVKSPQSLGGSPVTIHLYVENVDIFITNAIKAGAQELKPIQDQFFGDRSGSIVDPFGHIWNIATHQKDISNEEISKQFKKMFEQS